MPVGVSTQLITVGATLAGVVLTLGVNALLEVRRATDARAMETLRLSAERANWIRDERVKPYAALSLAGEEVQQFVRSELPTLRAPLAPSPDILRSARISASSATGSPTSPRTHRTPCSRTAGSCESSSQSRAARVRGSMPLSWQCPAPLAGRRPTLTNCHRAGRAPIVRRRQIAESARLPQGGVDLSVARRSFVPGGSGPGLAVGESTPRPYCASSR